MDNSRKVSKRFKRIIIIVVAAAVMIGMTVPTVAMESNEAAGDEITTIEQVPVSDTGGDIQGNPEMQEEPVEDMPEPNDTKSEEEEPKASEEPETPETPESEEDDPVDETEAIDIEEQTDEFLFELYTPDAFPETPLAAPGIETISPLALGDWSPALMYPDVVAVWLDAGGSEISAPAGASITVTLMDKGPQNSYADWTPSQTQYNTSKNTETLRAENSFNGWFDNILIARSKKLVVSGIPEGYTVTFGDPSKNDAVGEYPYNQGGPLTEAGTYYVNLTKTGSAVVTLEGITVKTPPSKTVYTEGESFDLAGMVVEANYSDGSSKVVTGYTYSPAGALTADTSQITVTYKEGGIQKTATTPVTVNEAVVPALDSIEVTAPPTQTAYTVGDAFDPEGLVVTAKYTNGGADKILTSSEYTLSAPDMGTAGTKTVTVTYEENGVTKTATFNITVTAPAPVLDNIEVTAPPTQTAYTVGDAFDPAGLVVTAKYTNSGADKILTSSEYTLSAPDMDTAGTKAITVTYEENGVTKTATFNITVTAPAAVLGRIEVTQPPDKTEYTEGEFFDRTGMKVMANYSDGSTRELADHEYTYTPDSALASSDSQITVMHQGYTAALPIRVNAKTAPTPEPAPSPAPTSTPTSVPGLDSGPGDGSATGTTADSTEPNANTLGNGGSMPQTGVQDTMAAAIALFFVAVLALLLLLTQMTKKNEISVQGGEAILLKGGIFRKIRNKFLGRALAVLLAARMHRMVKKQE